MRWQYNFLTGYAPGMRLLARGILALGAGALMIGAACATAQTVEFKPPSGIDDPTLEASIRTLAYRAMQSPDESDQDARLSTLSTLQLATARFAEASETLATLRELRQQNGKGADVRAVAMEIYATAKARETSSRDSFAQALEGSFAQVFSQLNDRAAYDTAWLLGTRPAVFQDIFQQTLQRHPAAARIPVQEGVGIVRDFTWWRAFASAGPMFAPLVDADQKRRYVIDENVLVKTPDGASISAIVVRSKSGAAARPTLLSFGIDTDSDNIAAAVDTAAHDYVAVTAFTRGKINSTGPIEPYERDGADARALIEWISRQPWSDGRVGMYSGSYGGFTQWAALKKPPPALKAIMSSAIAAPGPAEPAYDRHWQRVIPYGEEFARINIPVLQTMGYYDGGQVSTLYYFTQHRSYNRGANHTLLIGPYDHDLRYAWFDHVFKSGPRPEILADAINYQVMGANEWRHARTIVGMSDGSLRLYLAPGALSKTMPTPDAFTELTHDALEFASEPFKTDTVVSGQITGTLDFVINKKDMDFSMRWYELTAAGDYVQLTIPYSPRASFLRDPGRRQLLVPGKRQQLSFANTGLISRKMKAGSRLVLLLGINSAETRADAKQPLRVQWFGSSMVQIPVSQ